MSGDETASAGARRVAAFLAGLVLVCLAFLLLAPPGGDSRTGVLGAVPLYLMVVLAGVSWRPGADSGRQPGIYLLGMLAGAASLAEGVVAWAGTLPTLGAAALLTILFRWLGRRSSPAPKAAPAAAAEQAPYVLLLGSVIADAVALFTGYLPAVRSPAYAFADMGTAFVLGALATLALWRRAGRLSGAPVAAALVVMAVALVNALSFFGYPSLLVSGSAVLQTSAYLLTPGRVFPFYALAFALGVPAGLLWCGEGPRLGRKAVWIGPLLAVLAAGLLARWTYAGPYALAVALALAAAVAAWARGPRGSVVLRVVTVAAGALGLVWLVAGDPHMQWAGLRTTLGSVLRVTGPTGQLAPAGRPVSAELTAEGWRVVLQEADVRATFLDGNLIGFQRTGGMDQLAAVRACVALGLACAPAEGKVEMAQPVLTSMLDTLNALAPDRESVVPGDEKKSALIVSGPGPLTAAGDPLSALNVGHLSDLRGQLADGGVLALWLPAGNLHVGDLRRTLATVGAVFPRYDVYLIGRAAVVIAGGSGRISYERLAAPFKEGSVPAYDNGWAALAAPTASPSKEMLADAGFRDPMDLLEGFVGSAEDLAGLTAGARPYSVWRPARPPAMALDLAEPARPAAMLALAQYRALGTERLLGRLQFENPAQKLVALRGFGAIYADLTSRTLGELGVSGPGRRLELLEFLTSPQVRLDLLAPGQKEREEQIAAALAAIGLRESGAAVLRNAIKSGRDTFEVNVELADIEEALAQKGEALKHLRRALELKPDSTTVRGHVVALLLSMGQEAEAAGELEQMVKQKPDDVATLLELGYLYAKLKRYQDAASTAEHVLRIDPNNEDAQALLELGRRAKTATQPPEAPAPENAPAAPSE